jgi:precorrin-3B synthase
VNALAPVVKGWCPGALRPMPTGDGLLARVRPSAGRLSLDQVEALAEAAGACGNGAIEISSRANLQLRGVRPEKLGELEARFAAIGLVDADPEVERVRNIVASPLADLDPEASCDVAPHVAALEARIARDADLRALPAKFGFVIDAGGRWPLGDVEADVRFEGFVSGRGLGFVVRLPSPPAGMPELVRGIHGIERPDTRRAGRGGGTWMTGTSRVMTDSAVPGVTITSDDLPAAAARIARAFRVLAGSGAGAPRRMRALLERQGAGAVFAAAGLEPRAIHAPSRAASSAATVGVLDLRIGVALGVAPPFGRMQAAALAGLVRAASDFGASGARLTPWRTIVLPGLDPARASRLAQALEALGFIVARDDRRLRVVACPGAPACAHANADTLGDAARLAASFSHEILHVSGCAKGCAHAAPAPFTLVATPEGYDLVIGGRAGDAPTHRGLSLASAAALVGGLSA